MDTKKVSHSQQVCVANSLIFITSSSSLTGPISSNLFNAIMTVESNGNINAVGDGGKAIGPFQIHEVYWQDAAQHDLSIKADGTYQNCKGEGSIAYSERVMQACVGSFIDR